MSLRTFFVVALLAIVLAITIYFAGFFFQGFSSDQGVVPAESTALAFIRIPGKARALVEADVSPNVPVSLDAIETTASIVRSRLDSLNILALVDIQDNRHFAIEFLDSTDSRAAIESSTRVGLLEFVDLGDTLLSEGTIISTTGATVDNSCPDDSGTMSTPTTIPGSAPRTERVYRTVMTGSCLRNAIIRFTDKAQPYISFTLKDKGTNIFRDHTSANIGKYLAIVLDKQVLSSPVIIGTITDGNGAIQGQFSRQEASQLLAQLRYGNLPFPLRIVETTPIGK